MHEFVAKHMSEIAALCRRHHVRRLDLFGSAATDDFDPDKSDLDFLVEFEDMRPTLYKDAYFGLFEALGDLFDRPVDLVTKRSMRNPYFIRSVTAGKQALYAA